MPEIFAVARTNKTIWNKIKIKINRINKLIFLLSMTMNFLSFIKPLLSEFS